MTKPKPVYAPIRGMRDLVNALRAAQQERNISQAQLGELAGVDGYVAKLFAGLPMRNLGYQSMGELLQALGKQLVMVDDPEQVERMEHRWDQRKRPQKLPKSSELDGALLVSADDVPLTPANTTSSKSEAANEQE
jgi:hypothetical protein